MYLSYDLTTVIEEDLQKCNVKQLREECARRYITVKRGAHTKTCIKKLIHWKYQQNVHFYVRIRSVYGVISALRSGGYVNSLNDDFKSPLLIITSLLTQISKTSYEYKNCVSIILILLDSGADPNYEDEYGMTALYYMAMINELEICKVLIACGADPNIKDDEGISPLHCAVTVENEDIIKLLLEYGADVGVKNALGNSVFDYTDNLAIIRLLEKSMIKISFDNLEEKPDDLEVREWKGEKCPVMLEVMTDKKEQKLVVSKYGHVYTWDGISECLNHQEKCPLTKQCLKHCDLYVF